MGLLRANGINNEIWFKIPTGRRQTSWLFTNVAEELNLGLARNNSTLVVRTVLEPATSGFQFLRPDHSAMTLPFSSTSLNKLKKPCDAGISSAPKYNLFETSKLVAEHKMIKTITSISHTSCKLQKRERTGTSFFYCQLD